MELNNFYYKVIDNNIVITGFKTNTVKEVIIPEGVTKIEKNAFADKLIHKVSFPKSLTHICSGAFNNCQDLKVITFDDNCHLTIIEEYAFSNCVNLTSINFPNNLKEIQYNAFFACEKLKEVFIPRSINKLGAGVFEDCNKKLQINIHLHSIPSTFHIYWNEQGYTVNLLGENTNKKAINIPTKTAKREIVNSVSTDKISRNDSLNKYSKEEDLIIKYENNEVILAGVKNDNKELVVPPCITSVAYNAFYGNKTLETFIAEDTLHFIASRAFDCSEIKRIKFSKNTRVASTAFLRCDSLENAYVSKNVSGRAYGCCAKIKDVVIDEDVERIEYEMFSYCPSIEKIYIPDSINTICRRAFVHCAKLNDIRFSPNIDYIYEEAFAGCNSLTKINLPNKLTRLGEKAFFTCKNLKEVQLNEGLTSIGEFAFMGCAIEKLTIPSSLRYIGRKAFALNPIKEIVIEIRRGQPQTVPNGFIDEWYDKKLRPLIKFKTVK